MNSKPLPTTHVLRDLDSLLQGIELCNKAKLTLPTLVLIYSGIDIMASLYRRNGETSKNAFLRWVGDFMLVQKIFPCSAIDIYAARCSMLHTLTAFSELHKQGKAKGLLYAWGNANREALEKATAVLGHKDFIVVHVNDLIVTFRTAIADFFTLMENDKALAANANQISAHWFDGLSKQQVEDFLAAYPKKTDT